MTTTASAAPSGFPFKNPFKRSSSREPADAASSSRLRGPQKSSSTSKLASKKYPAPSSAAPTSYEDANPVNGLRSLEEALMCISDTPPHVARSTPKGVFIDTSKGGGGQRDQACLYSSQVYDSMLQQSLDACAALQDNLDDYIDQVRNTPASTVPASPLPALKPLDALHIPASGDSGNGTVSSLSGHDSLSPIPQSPSDKDPASPQESPSRPANGDGRMASPSKTVTFREEAKETDKPKSPEKKESTRRRVLRMVKF